jgi:Nif-specific regulatory protein
MDKSTKLSEEPRAVDNVQEITYLYEIANALNATIDLKKSVYSVLEILAKALEIKNATITILNPLRDEIRIEVAHGLSANAMQRGRYKPGEGITGRVIQEGKPIVVPKISEEPNFLNRTAARRKSPEETSFICVPVKKGKQVVGALSADFTYDPARDLEASKHRLTVVSALLAQHVINLETVQREKEALRFENLRLQKQLVDRHSISNIVGNSNKMREVYQMIVQVRQSNATVLIRGESGTGKELVANAIHFGSHRSKQAFVKLNCAALPVNLIESELFGHEKGAFTGAIQTKRGKFELADKGTIFLDEIGSISLEAQFKLLRVLQEKEFERIGGSRTIQTDVRIIAATNKDLEKGVEEGTFRGDLYYRLNVFPIYIPPLRERKTDILLLAEFFLEKYARENKKEIRRLSTPAIDMLTQYHWPGNVRELENCIERAVLLCEENVIHSYHLPPTLQTGEESDTLPSQSMEESVGKLEKELLIDALKNTRGNMAKAAEMLKTTERKFTYKTRKYDIDYRQYRR